MSTERPEFQYQLNNDDCGNMNEGTWGEHQGFNEDMFVLSIQQIDKVSVIDPLVKYAHEHGGIVKILEIGASDGSAAARMITFLSKSIPSDLKIEMTLIDCNPTRTQDMDIPDHIPENFSITYLAGTEASAFFERDDGGYSLIYGFSIEFLLAPENEDRKETRVVRMLREHANKLLLPQGICVFSPGRENVSKNSTSTPLLPFENFKKLPSLKTVTLIRREE